MKQQIRRMMAPLAAAALLSGFAGMAAITGPSVANAAPVHTSLRAGPPPPSTNDVWTDNTWENGPNNNSNIVGPYGSSEEENANTNPTTNDSYTLTYHTTYYCLYDQTAGAYVAAYSPSGIVKAAAGACGTNEEWSITCVGGSSESLYLSVKAGPLAGDVMGVYSETPPNSVEYVGLGTDDEMGISGECGG